ncbi:MAG: hypothetical protein U0324_43965 [Polyangiales bacterium]
MLPLIGVMVAVTGVVVCAYVLVRAMELSQRDTSSSGTRALLGLLALVALGGAGTLAFLASELWDRGTRVHDGSPGGRRERGADAAAPEN